MLVGGCGGDGDEASGDDASGADAPAADGSGADAGGSGSASLGGGEALPESLYLSTVQSIVQLAELALPDVKRSLEEGLRDRSTPPSEGITAGLALILWPLIAAEEGLKGTTPPSKYAEAHSELLEVLGLVKGAMKGRVGRSPEQGLRANRTRAAEDHRCGAAAAGGEGAAAGAVGEAAPIERGRG